MKTFTEENFTLEELLKIKLLLEKASFVAVDCEFTSVSSAENKFLFSQNDLYLKKKKVVENALLTELGVTIFADSNGQ